MKRDQADHDLKRPDSETLSALFKEHVRLIVEEKRINAEEKRVEQRLLWVAVTSAVVAIMATAAGVWSAYEAHMTRKEGTELAYKAMTLEQRPYLKMQMTGLETTHSDGKVTVSTPKLTLTAYGRTLVFTLSVLTMCSYLTGETGLEKDVHTSQFSGSQVVGGVLPPGESNTGNVYCTDEARRGYAANNRKFVVTGNVAYSDIFEKRHVQSFCFLHLVEPGIEEWVDCPSDRLEKKTPDY